MRFTQCRISYLHSIDVHGDRSRTAFIRQRTECQDLQPGKELHFGARHRSTVFRNKH